MTSTFFATIFLFLCLPPLVGKLLRVEKIFPLVFLQLVVGLAMRESGALAWLQAHDADLLRGSLGVSIQGLGWLGVVIMIALAGGESMPGDSGKSSLRFVPISMSGFFVTFAVGSLIGYQLAGFFPAAVGARAGPLLFACTVGLTLSVTALPVLISILRDTRLSGTLVGNLAVNCAMLDDVWLWLGIAVILSASGVSAEGGAVFPLLAVYVAAMFLVVRPLLARWYGAPAQAPAATPGHGSQVNVVLAFVSLVCLSAMLTNLIGLHPLFGAFVGGVIFPRRALHSWTEALTSFSHALLLPFYFIVTGMRLELNFGDPAFWMLTAIVTSAAVMLKFSSVSVAARLSGLSWRQSGVLGCLMQCKGLMELIAINIFLDAGLIGPQIYSALAMMALVSTMITAPTMALIGRSRKSALAAAGPVAG